MRTVEAFTAPRAAVTEDVPGHKDAPRPVELMVATACVAELQVTDVVRSCWVPSVRVPVALNCCVVPNAIDGLGGFTVIDTKAALFTVRVVEAEIKPDVAEMLELPAVTVVARPWLPATLLMVATAPVAELHWTELVMFCVVPSVNVPVASN